MVWEILIAAFLVLGGVFGLVGSIGLVKFPDPMTRLHAPTKATTLGVGGVLIASMLYFASQQGHFSFHELLITLFLFLTAPVSAHFLAKANLHRDWRPKLLPQPEGTSWASFSHGSDTAAEALAGGDPGQALTAPERRDH
jgi:multicomponent K+:H+ antiporter subunit G